PLCLASMNTPLEQACAQLFANVLRDSLGAGPDACKVLVSRVDLSSLWPEKLPEGIRLLRGHTARQLQALPEGVLLEGQHFDAVIVAGNVQATRRLLGQLPQVAGAADYLSVLGAFSSLPIATLTLDLSAPWEMPLPMLMLNDSPKQGRFGQWLFHCNRFMRSAPTNSRLNIVISNAVGLGDYSEAQIVEGVLAQIAEQGTKYAPLPALQGYELITEKRATFAAVTH